MNQWIIAALMSLSFIACHAGGTSTGPSGAVGVAGLGETYLVSADQEKAGPESTAAIADARVSAPSVVALQPAARVVLLMQAMAATAGDRPEARASGIGYMAAPSTAQDEKGALLVPYQSETYIIYPNRRRPGG